MSNSEAPEQRLARLKAEVAESPQDRLARLKADVAPDYGRALWANPAAGAINTLGTAVRFAGDAVRDVGSLATGAAAGYGTVPEAVGGAIAGAGQAIQEAGPRPERAGFLGDVLSGIGSTAAIAPAALAGPGGIVGASILAEGGAEYYTHLEAKPDDRAGAWRSALIAAPVAALEVAPLGKLTKILGKADKGGDLMKVLAMDTAQVAAGEAGQEFLQAGASILNRSLRDEEIGTLNEILGEMGYQAAVGAAAGGSLGSLASMARLAQERQAGSQAVSEGVSPDGVRDDAPLVDGGLESVPVTGEAGAAEGAAPTTPTTPGGPGAAQTEGTESAATESLAPIYRALQAQAERAGYKGQVQPAEAPERLTPFVEEARSRGADVVFFQGTRGSTGNPAAYVGDTIALDASITDEAAQRELLVHELVHHAKANSEAGTWEGFAAELQQAIPELLPEVQAGVLAKRPDLAGSPDVLAEEVAAETAQLSHNAVAQALADPAMVRQIATQNPGLLRRIVDKLREIAARFTSRVDSPAVRDLKRLMGSDVWTVFEGDMGPQAAARVGQAVADLYRGIQTAQIEARRAQQANDQVAEFAKPADSITPAYAPLKAKPKPKATEAALAGGRGLKAFLRASGGFRLPDGADGQRELAEAFGGRGGLAKSPRATKGFKSWEDARQAASEVGLVPHDIELSDFIEAIDSNVSEAEADRLLRENDERAAQGLTAGEQRLMEEYGSAAFADDPEFGEDVQQGEDDGEPFTLFATAYHGTGAQFDEFSDEAIGTGEGAQAYGYGHYFASARDVGEHYRKTVAGDALEQADGTPFDPSTIQHLNVRATLNRTGDAGKAIQRARGIIESDPGSKMAQLAQQDLETLLAAGPLTKRMGHLLQVDLAPEQDEYLLWDEPLSKQSLEVALAIEKYQGGPIQNRSQTGEDFYNSVQRDFEEGGNEARAASQALLQAGIRGIKYLDGTSRGRPLRDIKRAFLDALPEDAEIDEVAALVGTKQFTPQQNRVLAALVRNDWLGFDYPARAISVALGKDLGNFDPTPGLVDAVSAIKADGASYNYVIFDVRDISIVARFATANPGYEYPSADKNKADGLISDAHRLANFDKRTPFLEQGLGRLKVPRQRVVLSAVFRVGQHPQVAKPVIGTLPVDVMDVLRRQEIPPERLFDDETVFRDLFTVDGNAAVSGGVNAADAAVRHVARAAAEMAGVPAYVRRRLLRAPAAVGTVNFGQGTIPGGALSGAEGVTAPSGPASVARDPKDVTIEARFATAPPTDSPAFKRWFGKSVVTEDGKPGGKPLVVYHSTHADFTEPDLARAGSSLGFHVGTAEQAQATQETAGTSSDTNAKRPDTGQRIMPLFVRLSRPLRMEDKGPWYSFEVVERLASEHGIIDDSKLPVNARELAGYDSSHMSLTWERFSEARKRYEVARRQGMRSYMASNPDAGREAIQAEGIRVANEYARNLIRSAGHDGVVYANKFEGEGDSYIAFSPTQIKSATGNRGTYDPGNPDIRFATDKRRKGDITVPTPTAWDASVQYVQDTMAPLKRLEAVTGKGRAASARQIATLYGDRAAARIRRFNETHWDPFVAYAQEHWEDNKTRQDLIERYLYAKSAPGRNKVIAKRTEGKNLAGSGMTTADANRIVAGMESSGKGAAYKELSRRWDAMMDAHLDLLVEYGLESQKTVDAYRELFPHYVPLKTLDENVEGSVLGVGKGADIRGKEFKRAMGRGTLADSPIAHGLAAVQRTVLRGEKNKAGLELLKLKRELGDRLDGFVSMAKPRRVKPKRTVDGEIVMVFEGDTYNDPLEIGVKEGGTEYRLKFEPEYADFAEAMHVLTARPAGQISRHVAKVTRKLAQLSTSWNPVFPIFNAIRDAGTVFFTSGEHGLAFASNVLRDIPKAWQAYAGKGPWKQRLREFQDEGGQLQFAGLDAIDQITGKVESAIEGVQDLRGKKRWAKSMLKAFEAFSEAVENGARLSAYVHATDMLGMSKQAAAYYAKEVSTNFRKKGLAGNQLNAWYMFSNAGIQGTARVARALTDRRVQKLVGAAATMSAILDTYNRMRSEEDDDGERYYDAIPDYVKRNNLIISLDGKRHLMIPLPFVYNWFHTLGVKASELSWGAATGEEVTSLGEAVGDMTIAAIDSFNPLGGTDQPATLVSPTILDPFSEIWVNKDFAGREIARKPFPGQELPASEQYWPSVNPTVRGLTTWLNKAFGGDEFESSSAVTDINPEHIEHLGKFATGGLGATFGRVYDMLNKGVTGQEMEEHRIPGWRRIMNNPSPYALGSRYKDARSRVDVAQKRVKAGSADLEERRLAGLRNYSLSIDRRVKAMKERLEALEGEQALALEKQIRQLQAGLIERVSDD